MFSKEPCMFKLALSALLFENKHFEQGLPKFKIILFLFLLFGNVSSHPVKDHILTLKKVLDNAEHFCSVYVMRS